jgi:hypothetical protein
MTASHVLISFLSFTSLLKYSLSFPPGAEQGKVSKVAANPTFVFSKFEFLSVYTGNDPTNHCPRRATFPVLDGAKS